jgi:hypothetical protein
MEPEVRRPHAVPTSYSLIVQSKINCPQGEGVVPTANPIQFPNNLAHQFMVQLHLCTKLIVDSKVDENEI